MPPAGRPPHGTGLGPFSPHAAAAAAALYQRLKEEDFEVIQKQVRNAQASSRKITRITQLRTPEETSAAADHFAELGASAFTEDNEDGLFINAMKAKLGKRKATGKFQILEQSKTQLRTQLNDLSGDMLKTLAVCQEFTDTFFEVKEEAAQQHEESECLVHLLEELAVEHEADRIEMFEMSTRHESLEAKMADQDTVNNFLRSELEMATEVEMGRTWSDAATVNCQELADAREAQALRRSLLDFESKYEHTQTAMKRLKDRRMEYIVQSCEHKDLFLAWWTWKRHFALTFVPIAWDQVEAAKVVAGLGAAVKAVRKHYQTVQTGAKEQTAAEEGAKDSPSESRTASGDARNSTSASESNQKAAGSKNRVPPPSPMGRKSLEYDPKDRQSSSMPAGTRSSFVKRNTRTDVDFEKKHTDPQWVAAAAWRQFELMANLVADKAVETIGVGFKSLPPYPIVIHKVAEGSWAAEHGLKEGDEILVMNNQLVRDMTAELFGQTMMQRPLRMKVWRSVIGNEQFFDSIEYLRPRSIPDFKKYFFYEPPKESMDHTRNSGHGASHGASHGHHGSYIHHMSMSASNDKHGVHGVHSHSLSVHGVHHHSISASAHGQHGKGNQAADPHDTARQREKSFAAPNIREKSVSAPHRESVSVNKWSREKSVMVARPGPAGGDETPVAMFAGRMASRNSVSVAPRSRNQSISAASFHEAEHEDTEHTDPSQGAQQQMEHYDEKQQGQKQDEQSDKAHDHHETDTQRDQQDASQHDDPLNSADGQADQVVLMQMSEVPSSSSPGPAPDEEKQSNAGEATVRRANTKSLTPAAKNKPQTPQSKRSATPNFPAKAKAKASAAP